MLSIILIICELKKQKSPMTHITVNNITISTDNSSVAQHLYQIGKAPKFLRWLNSVDLDIFDIQHINIKEATWFCQPQNIAPEKLGFLYLEANVFDKRNGKRVPGIVFLRGGAVAVHIELETVETGQTYCLLTRQARFPSGADRVEITAGMVDDSGDFQGVMKKEIQEETGLIVPNIDQMVDLGYIYPSPGGCDEIIKLYYWKTTTTEAELKEMKSKVMGASEVENIHLEFVSIGDYEERLDQIGDVKAECAWRRVQAYKRKSAGTPTTKSQMCTIM